LGAREKGLALPKSVESGKLSLNKAGIRWMSVKIVSSHPPVIAANWQN
jgi:hypothetical protein